jgi:hypothetical protein
VRAGNVKRVASAVVEKSIAIVARVRGEYVEMPGLRVTLEQACRLRQVDVSTCEMLLEYLVRTGVLCKTDSGFYIAAASARR